MLPVGSKVLVRNSVPSPLGGISLAGVSRFGRGVPVPNRVLNRYSLVYVFDGSGVYTDETVTDLPVSSGDIIQILPNTKHGYGPKEGRDWHEVYIIFEGPIFNVWYEQGCFEFNNQVTSLKPIEYWRDRFISAIGQASGDEGTFGAISEVLRVQDLLLDIHKALRVGFSENTEWLQQAKQALATEKTSQAAAQQLGIGYEAFRKKFRKIYGVPPSRYQANLEMEKACDLLTQTSYSIREVANLLDYCDEFHFSKRFTQIIGCAPSTYRARTYSH